MISIVVNFHCGVIKVAKAAMIKFQFGGKFRNGYF